MSYNFSNEDIADFVLSLLKRSDRSGYNSINIECHEDGTVSFNYMLADDTETNNMGVYHINDNETLRYAYRMIRRSRIKRGHRKSLKYKLNDLKKRFLLALEVFVWKDLSDWRH